MAAYHTDRILGAVLVIVAALWTWAVIETIPFFDDGSGLGARGFPLGLGVLLGVLGFILLVRSFVIREAGEAGAAEPAVERTDLRHELWAVGMVLLLPVYAALMQYTGFVIATFVTVALAVGPMLGLWRPRLLLGMSLGLSLGIYLIFGKLLGVYLPYGTWINLAF